MDYSTVKVGFLPPEKIKKDADRIRKQNRISDVPVNVELLLEKLGIFIEAKSLLFQRTGAEALITSSWDMVLVDFEKYMDDNYINRLRFSLAHEFGHMILHRDLFESFQIKDEKTYRDFFSNIPEVQYKKIETQANMFANNFLVPNDVLAVRKREVISELKLSSFANSTLHPYLANFLCNEFGVSVDVMEIALKYN